MEGGLGAQNFVQMKEIELDLDRHEYSGLTVHLSLNDAMAYKSEECGSPPPP